MPSALRALRGATTLDVDDKDHLFERVIALLDALFERNALHHDDLISVLFTATDDIHSAFPALAARKFGLGDVPLICARELDIEGGTPMCIRVMIHVQSDRPRQDFHHVYLEGARNLRDDLPALWPSAVPQSRAVPSSWGPGSSGAPSASACATTAGT